MKIKFALITLVAAALLAGPASVIAQAPVAANAVVVDAAMTDTVFQLYEGTVTKIDKKTRTIFFQNNDGESKFIAGPEIKNFDQIKKGDRLNVSYELAVAIELIKTKSDGIRSKVETSSEATSKPGEKPTRTITNTTIIIADIIAVDRAKKLVSVKGPSGKVTVVTVKNPQLLADANVGEQVKVIYFDAMAASITTPKKK
jgi:lipopolysaccharide export LptBFGC system permease protein LptF